MTTSYEEILAEFEAAIGWAAGLGAKIDDKGRFAQYHYALRGLVANYKKASEEELSQRFEEYADVMLEATDFCDIAEGISKIKLDNDGRNEVSKRLQIMFGGPYRQKDEDENDPKTIKPRNIGLELVIAALYARAGLPIIFQKPADLVTKFEGAKIYIEAKRCRSEGKIVRRFNDAIEQCNVRVERSGSSVSGGIAMVDFSVVANPKGGIAAFDSDQDAQRSLQGAIDSFAKEYVPKIALDKMPRTFALMIRYSGMVRSRTLLSRAQQWGVVVNSNLQANHGATANAIAQILHQSIAG